MTIQINSLAEFKRSMTIGSLWSFYDSRDTGVYTLRKCVKSQNTSFALDNHPNCRDKTTASWLDYPKAKELIFVQNADEATRVKIKTFNNHYMVYQPIGE